MNAKKSKGKVSSISENSENAELRRVDLSTARLGRYPFRSAIRYYAAFQEGNLSKSTLDVDLRKLRQFAGVFEKMKEFNKVLTTDPRRFDQSHISEFIIWMKVQNLNLSTQEKYMQILGRLLAVFGNNTIRKMRGDPTLRLPKGNREKPIRALNLEELQKVFDSADKVDGYRGIIMRGYFAIAFGTGCRPKEIVSGMVEDLDLKNAMYFVRHPKGEGAWADPQWIPIIRGDMVPRIQRFLCERQEYLNEHGFQSDYLFMNPSRDEPITDYSIRRMKKVVERMSGVNFQLKDFRSSLASISVEGDISRIHAVSLQLRHKSVDTTSTYYTRINKTNEIKNTLEEVWKKKKIK